MLFSGNVAASSSVVLCQKRYFAKGKKDGQKGNNAKKQVQQDSAETKREIEFLTKFLEAAEESKRYLNLIYVSFNLLTPMLRRPNPSSSYSRIKFDYSDEELAEHARIAKNYQRKKLQEKNKMNKDIADKIWLQQEAMRALPDHLRAAAEVIDDEPPPEDREFTIWQTPPIKGFNIRDYENDGVDEDGDGEDEKA